MKKYLLVVLILTIAVSSRGQTITDLRKMFDYDKGEDLDVRIVSTKDTLQGTLQEIVFNGGHGIKVTGCLIIPKQKLREFPAVIFLNDASQSRNAFLPQALDLANNAFASLLIDALPNRPEAYRMTFRNFSDPRKDLAAYKQAVLDIRRSVDFLEQHSRIDRNRIAFFGNGNGAMTGAILSGVETRILNYILMACSPCCSCELRYSNDPLIVKARNILTQEQITQYELSVKVLNPSNYLPYHRKALVFFQFGQADPNYDEKTSRELFQLTGEPKCQKTYNTTNLGLNAFEEAMNDQKNWLKAHL
jgi:predicted esterase